jgi:pilus assembly protein Flp/PilA
LSNKKQTDVEHNKTKKLHKKESAAMLKIISKIQAYKTNEEGATAIEYGLIAAGIAVAISVVVFTFGGELTTLFDDMSGKLGERPE